MKDSWNLYHSPLDIPFTSIRQPEIQCSEDGGYIWAKETSSLEMESSLESREERKAVCRFQVQNFLRLKNHPDISWFHFLWRAIPISWKKLQSQG
ncbi:Cation Channel Sperm-Associated Protein Subunit Epsilon [Manis pentadactyla]|nr:Cation Channel Sperm-Associated Protein Subunit Epsilon [Manis pentadactyla]